MGLREAPEAGAVRRLVAVILGGQTVALTLAPLRLLETSDPPVYYLPPDSIVPRVLVPTGRPTSCELEGVASYRLRGPSPASP